MQPAQQSGPRRHCQTTAHLSGPFLDAHGQETAELPANETPRYERAASQSECLLSWRVLLNLCLCSGLRELSVTGLPWSCLSAMVSPTLPHLRLLDLRWCDGVTDAQIKEIVTLPGQWHGGLSELCFTPILLQALGGAAPPLLEVQWPHCRAARDMFFSVIVIS